MWKKIYRDRYTFVASFFCFFLQWKKKKSILELFCFVLFCALQIHEILGKLLKQIIVKNSFFLYEKVLTRLETPHNWRYSTWNCDDFCHLYTQPSRFWAFSSQLIPTVLQLFMKVWPVWCSLFDTFFFPFFFCLKCIHFWIASTSAFPLLKCKWLFSNSILQFSNGSSQSDLQTLMTVL